MTDHVGAVLAMLCLLQLKHMFADYFLQTPKMLSGRGEYWHLGRAQHAGIHALGSAIVLAIMGAPAIFTLVLMAAEWFVHFNIDFFKASYSEHKKYTPAQAGFWRAAGVDQFMHHLTYIVMVWAWVAIAA